MKYFFLIANLLFSFYAFTQVEDAVPSAPSPQRLYNDFTANKNFLTPEQAQYLERKLVAYDDSTSNQIAIVIVNDLKGYTANEYATALGRKWGVGGRDNNNGVVVLLSTEEGNRDAYIAVGYGLEGAITDVTAKAIVDAELIPNLRNGDYYRALDQSVNALIKAAAGEYSAPKGYGSRKGPGIQPIIIGIIALWIILAIFGRGGRGGGGYASRRGYRGFWGPTIWGTGGGGWGGGGWSGGGGGGGFGGFGGGSFGGGGAGGKW